MRWFFTLLPRTIRYLADRRVPFYYKVLPFLFIPFFFTPVARLMSLVPVLGLLDEFTILLISLALFTWLSEKALKRREAREARNNPPVTRPSQIIEGDYEVLQLKAKPARAKETLPADAHEVKHSTR
jgi:hypothetical protein